MSGKKRTNNDKDDDPAEDFTQEDPSNTLEDRIVLDDERVLEMADFIADLLLLQPPRAQNLIRSKGVALVAGDLHRMQRHWGLDGSSHEEIAASFLDRFRRTPMIQPAARNEESEQEPKFKPDPNRKRKNRPSGLKYKERAAKKKDKKEKVKTHRDDDDFVTKEAKRQNRDEDDQSGYGGGPTAYV